MSDLTADDIAQLRHHIADHRATCASSCAIIERLLAARVADAERVLSVVREAVLSEFDNYGGMRPTADRADRIAARAAEQLAGAGAGLSSSDRVRLQSIIDLLRKQPVCWDMEKALLDRLLASPPATNVPYMLPVDDEADAAVTRALAGRTPQPVKLVPVTAICALLDSDMPAGEMRKALAELVGRR